MVINQYLSSIFKTLNYTLLYTDFVTVYRQIEVEKDNGSTGYEKKRVYNKIPCRLSQVIPDKSDYVSIDINPLSIILKVFCDTSLWIQKGDYISCVRVVDGKKHYYQGLANEPIRYQDGHQEFIIHDTAEGSSKSFEENISDQDEEETTPPDIEEGDKDDSFSELFRY